jgi:methionyl-tRNA formyltransferase
MRLVFMGTPDFAAAILAALVEAGHEIACVYCQPPRPAGRGHKLQPSPVQAWAEARGLSVRHPVSLKGQAEQAEFAGLKADAAVVAAYGLILPQAILDAPKRGCLNVHASLLPRWRGAAPIQRAILAGDEETGVAIMRMEAGLDTGPALLVEKLPITASMNAGDLHDALAALGARLIVRALENLDRLVPEPQSEQGVTYAAKIGKEEGRLDWSLPAPLLARRVRAFAPLPGAWFDHQGERFKVLKAEAETGQGTPGTILDDALRVACGEGVLRLLILQRAGKGALDAQAFLRGYALPKGTVLA